MFNSAVNRERARGEGVWTRVVAGEVRGNIPIEKRRSEFEKRQAIMVLSF